MRTIVAIEKDRMDEAIEAELKAVGGRRDLTDTTTVRLLTQTLSGAIVKASKEKTE